MSATTAGRAGGCVHHPERAALGRCATCKRAVCGECHVRLDGILHCRDCLTAAEQDLRSERAPVLPRLGTALTAVMVLVPALLLSLVIVRGFGLAAGRLARFGAVAFENPPAVQPDAGEDGGR